MTPVTLFSYITPEEQERMRICFDMHEAVYRNNETVMEYSSSMKKIGLILEGQAVLYCIDEDGNQYMIDKLSHKLVEKLTIYFEKIINQGIMERVFSVKYPLETAELLMTAYVFVSNNISIRYLKEEPVDNYLNAFKIMLEQSLNTKKLFSN